MQKCHIYHTEFLQMKHISKVFFKFSDTQIVQSWQKRYKLTEISLIEILKQGQRWWPWEMGIELTHSHSNSPKKLAPTSMPEIWQKPFLFFLLVVTFHGVANTGKKKILVGLRLARWALMIIWFYWDQSNLD